MLQTTAVLPLCAIFRAVCVCHDFIAANAFALSALLSGGLLRIYSKVLCCRNMIFAGRFGVRARNNGRRGGRLYAPAYARTICSAKR